MSEGTFSHVVTHFYWTSLLSTSFNKFESCFNAKLFVVTAYAKKVLFYSVILQNIVNFHFPIVAVSVNYAKLDRFVLWMQILNKFHLLKSSEIFNIWL